MAIIRRTPEELFDAIREHTDCYFEMIAMQRAAKYIRTVCEIEEIAELLDERAAEMKQRMDKLQERKKGEVP